MQVRIIHSDWNPLEEVQQYEAQQSTLCGRTGATTVFIGTMRDFNEDDTVTQMELEYYPGMTEQYLTTMAQHAISTWNLLDVLIIHRVGVIKPAQPIVLVAVWSAHRREAYEANRCIMEDLKSRAPFWKKETLTNQSTRWVDKNTPGN